LARGEPPRGDLSLGDLKQTRNCHKCLDTRLLENML
jgi:hypothetical protein